MSGREHPAEPSFSPGDQARMDGGVLHTVIEGVAYSFRLRRPRAAIEAEFGQLPASPEVLAQRLVLEALLDVRELLEERLPMPITITGDTSPPPGNICGSGGELSPMGHPPGT